jgi:Arc/MetJ family transcription regulator
MKRTNIVLNDKLVEECFKATGIKTQRALIDHALRPAKLNRKLKSFLPIIMRMVLILFVFP